MLAVLALTLTSIAACATGRPAATGPSPVASPVLIDPLDPRAGEGPNRVGAPLLALLVVVGLGVAAAAATVVFVRLTRRT